MSNLTKQKLKPIFCVELYPKMNFVSLTKATVDAKKLSLPFLEQLVKTYLKENQVPYRLVYIDVIPGGKVCIKLQDIVDNDVQYILDKDRSTTTPINWCVYMSEHMNQYARSYISLNFDTYSSWSRGLAEILFQWLLDVKINLMAKYNS